MGELVGAVESPGSSFAYAYDLAGNRTGVTVNGTQLASYSYDAADQVVGWSYDQAGNLTGDGTTTYSYAALGRLTGTSATGQTRAYAYNGDGTLVSATVNGTSTTYAQDLAGGLSQVLAKVAGGTIVDYLYGDQRLAALTGGTRSWYGWDGQGSVRQGLSDSGAVTADQSYDPFGQPEGGSSPSTFGYRGELQDGATGALYLRARWYQPGAGTLLGVDPALGETGQPYAYAGDDPVNGSDPTGLAPPPNVQPTQADIDRLLQSVLDSWPNIVMPSSDTPPGNQPWPYFIGTFVHNEIARYYVNQNSGNVVWANTITVGTIVTYFGGDVGALSATQRAERPDIFDLTYRRIYEIKPYTSYGAAVTQLNKYLASFNAAHVYMVHAGVSGAPGTRGVVTAPGGYAVFASPADGVILYRKFNGRFTPRTAQSTDCSAAVLEHAVVTVVVTVFGIVVSIGGQILSPGSSDNPVPALA